MHICRPSSGWLYCSEELQARAFRKLHWACAGHPAQGAPGDRAQQACMRLGLDSGRAAIAQPVIIWDVCHAAALLVQRHLAAATVAQ